jgi:thiamine-monophosphate kinase
MNVSELGELDLIERLLGRLPAARPDVRVGPGDDVAAIDLGHGRWLLATTDAQVAGVHFLPERTDPRRLGRRAAAVNLSDIAAAGGRPTHFLVSLVVPPATEVTFLDALYDGLAEECACHDVDVIGGNVSAGPVLIVDLTLVGEVEAGAMLRRDGARVGDSVLVTGELGAAAAGLALTLSPELRAKLAAAEAEHALRALELPVPRVREGRALVRIGGATAAIDVSDGLAADLAHLCDRSGVGVRIDAAALPIARPASELARALAREPVDFALGGGEDYELLFTAPPDRVAALVDALRGCGTSVTSIGTIVASSDGRSLRSASGDERALGRSGYVHFA